MKTHITLGGLLTVADDLPTSHGVEFIGALATHKKNGFLLHHSTPSLGCVDLNFVANRQPSTCFLHLPGHGQTNIIVKKQH